MNRILVANMTREEARDYSRERRYCQLVSRDGYDLGFASEEFMHDYKGRGIRYHQAVRLLVWAPNSKDMLFRWSDSAWDSTVYGHLYYKEWEVEALHRLVNEQIKIDEPEMSMENILTRTNKLFSLDPCVATGMELVNVYSMTLRYSEILESHAPILSMYPRDVEEKAVANELPTTHTLNLALEELNSKYIF